MANRIGKKLLITYFLILLIFFIIAAVLFNALSRNYLLNETKKQLQEEGKSIAELLANIPVWNTRNVNDKLSEKISERLRMIKTARKFVDAEMIILNNEGKAIFGSNQNNNNILDIIDRLDRIRAKGYVVEKIPIVAKTGSTRGYVILYTQVENVYGINQLMRRSQIISFLIAGVFALLMGFAFEKSITRPIRQLMKKMNDYSRDKIINHRDIKTGDEIEELDACFKDMIIKIKQYEITQKKFLQNTSHELKTPLMSIQGYAEAVKDKVVEGKEADESLNIIIEQCQRLKRTVDEIIYLTKLENIDEKYTFEKISLQEIIRTAVNSIKPLADEGGISIASQLDAVHTGLYDKEKLLRALINILGNAVRYAKSTIKLSTNEDVNKTIIEIEDDGRGFAEGEEKKVFDRFYKGKDGNSGLGLAITKAIIEGHKGQIDALNGKMGGALFRIVLPKS
ncbi:MAG: sensor histidine kinase [Bacillota bacterium]